MMAAGYINVASHKDELNKINIFPLPDSDTGYNMNSTLRAGALSQVT